MACLVRDGVVTFQQSQQILIPNQGVMRPLNTLICHLYDSGIEQFLDFCLLLGSTADIVQDVFQLDINHLKQQKLQYSQNASA